MFIDVPAHWCNGVDLALPHPAPSCTIDGPVECGEVLGSILVDVEMTITINCPLTRQRCRVGTGAGTCVASVLKLLLPSQAHVRSMYIHK